MVPSTLTTVVRPLGQNAALRDRTVEPAGLLLEFEDVPVLIHAFRRMVRELAYDVCEMAVTTYLCAREHGVRFTALPVFPVRGLHHGAIVHNVEAGIGGPADLAGRRVGVNRGWTVTTGVWARGILADYYGLDLDEVTWVLSGDEHVRTYRPPANVVPAGAGKDLAEMLLAGEIDAAIGIAVDHPDVCTLIPDADAAAATALDRDGFYPINHLIVVRDDVLEREPTAARELTRAFTAAKDRYVDLLTAGLDGPTPDDRLNQQVMERTGADPLPYGVATNRAMLERLMGYAVDQDIVRHPVSVDSVFATPGAP
jgi:4,5-dihydroxyphthalate decarboxylase